jgi:hypothetical protein
VVEAADQNMRLQAHSLVIPADPGEEPHVKVEHLVGLEHQVKAILVVVAADHIMAVVVVVQVAQELARVDQQPAVLVYKTPY